MNQQEYELNKLQEKTRRLDHRKNPKSVKKGKA
jgi:hypothetical protein